MIFCFSCYASKNDVQVFSLSTDKNAASENIVISGLSLEEEILCITRKAENQGLKKFGLIFSSDNYGILLKKTLGELIADDKNSTINYLNLKEEIKNDREYLDKVSKKLIDQGLACWADATKKNKLIVTGTSKLLEDVTALEQLENIRILIEKLENKENLVGVIEETQEAEGLQIFIGAENSLFGMTGCSTIISPFRNRDKEIIGAIGVVGPMRINYAKIIPVVDYTAKLFARTFNIK